MLVNSIYIYVLGRGQNMAPAGGMPLCPSRAISIKLNATCDFCFRYR